MFVVSLSIVAILVFQEVQFPIQRIQKLPPYMRFSQSSHFLLFSISYLSQINVTATATVEDLPHPRLVHRGKCIKPLRV